MINPFELIVPRDDEIMINENFLRELGSKIKEHISEKRLVIIEGDYGTGKSLYMTRLFKRLTNKKEWLELTEVLPGILDTKVIVRNKSLFISNFDLIQGLTNESLEKLVNAMVRLIDNGMIILIACRKDIVLKLFSMNPLLRSKSQKFRIPTLTFDEAKTLIIARLNEARSSKSDDLSPFTDKEIHVIWHKCSGNPRLMLMLLNPLYEQRMLMRE